MNFLCCTPQTDTALCINYISIKLKRKNQCTLYTFHIIDLFLCLPLTTWVFVSAWTFLLLWKGVLPFLAVCGHHCGGFFCYRVWASACSRFSIGEQGLNSCSFQAIEHRLSNCGTRV